MSEIENLDDARKVIEKLKAQINADGVPHSEKACRKAMADEARMLLADAEIKCKRRVDAARAEAIRECVEVVNLHLPTGSLLETIVGEIESRKEGK